MSRFLLLVFLMLVPMVVWGQGSPSEKSGAVSIADSTFLARPGRWGPVADRADSNTARYTERSRPGWEKAVLVPYYVVGIPFRILDYVGHETIKAADRMGFFGLPPAEHPGLPLPLDTYLLPEFGISGLEGTSLGLNLTQYGFLGPDNRLFLTASTSTRHATTVAGGSFFHLNPKTSLQLGGGNSDLPLTKFYGLGPSSERDNLAYYHRGSWWAGFEADHILGAQTGLEMRAFFSRVEAKESRYEVDRSVGSVHPGNLPPGYPGISEGWTGRVGLIRSTTNENGRPESGGFQKASLALFAANDGTDLEFFTYTFDMQQFFPLWHTKRTLGLRAFFNRITNQSRVEIPMTRLVTFSRPDELRGFSSLRFYGLGSLGFSGEYRWPVWVSQGRQGPGLDAYVFSDVGQVFMKTQDIGLANMEYTGGFGFRFIGNNQKFVGRFELGFSNEETVVTLKFSQNFQYNGKGMYRGKDPTRRR